MGRVQRRIVRGVLWVVAHPKLTLGIAAAVLVASVIAAKLKLSVSSDQNKLFSPKVKFFADWLDFDRKFPENEAIYVVVEPHDWSAHLPVHDWVDLANRITARLRSMPEQVAAVVEKTPLDAPGAPGILFDDPKDLPEAFQGLGRMSQLAKLWGEPPGAIQSALGNTPLSRYLSAMNLALPSDREEGIRLLEAASSGLLQTAARPTIPPRLGVEVPSVAAANADTPAELGYFYIPDADPRDKPAHNLLLIRVYPKENRGGLTTQAGIIDSIRKAVEEESKPSARQFSVGLTGRPVLDADEDKTTEHDGRAAEILALAAVFIGLVVFLRSIWLAIVAEVSLAVAIGWTFGWATISIHELNLLSTVFLIALIGIGMDYLIQILAAYRREARRYIRPQAVWSRVFRFVGPPVNTACMGAAGAFLVSALTHFKGAAELGIIAGGGLLLCLISGYTVLPALLVLFPPKLKQYPAHARYGEAPPRTARRLLMPLAWVVLLLAGIPFMARAEFNPNLLDLQAPQLPSVQLVRKLQAWEAVVLSPDLNLLRNVRSAVEDAPSVAGTDSILRAIDNQKWLHEHAPELPKINWTEPPPITPDDLPGLASKARTLAGKLAGPSTTPADTQARQSLEQFANQITKPGVNTAQIASALSTWQSVFVAHLKSIMSMTDPPPVELPNIPPTLREHYASTFDQPPGHYLYALYIEPKGDLWKRENLSRFVQEVEKRVATVPGAPDVTGIASDVYHSTSSIEIAFYQATAYALALIFILVFLDLRNVRQTLIAVSVLGLGLPMLVAIMGLMNASWNFANFFGLPILIGAGHEYGVFLIHRYREAVHDPRRVWRRWDPADRALLLCAFVTSSSFGFFWLMSSHLGLKSLGLVMAIGTMCIYLAAILVVRSLLTWRLQKRRLASAAPEPPTDDQLW